MKEEVPFELTCRSQNLNFSVKRLDLLATINLIVISLVIFPAISNSIQKSTLNIKLITLSTDFSDDLYQYMQQIEEILIIHSCNSYQLDVFGKEDYLIYGHKSGLGSSSVNASTETLKKDVILKLLPDKWNYGPFQRVDVICKFCSDKELHLISEKLNSALQPKFKYLLQDVSRQYKAYNLISAPSLSFSGVSLSGILLPIFAVILALVFFHFTKLYITELNRFDSLGSNFIKSSLDSESGKGIVDSLTPNLAILTFKKYWLFPFKVKGILTLLSVYLLILLMWPIHIQMGPHRSGFTILPNLMVDKVVEALCVLGSIFIIYKSLLLITRRGR